MHTIQNAAGTTQTITGFTVNILNWNTPPGQPFPIPPDLTIHNITILSSKIGQNGGGPLLNDLPAAGFTCGTNSTACPQTPWLPTNIGENDATQIIIESTQRGSQPNPPPPPPDINTGANAHLH